MAQSLIRVYSYAKEADLISRSYHACVAPNPLEEQIFATCKSRDETLTGYLARMKSPETGGSSKDFQKPLFIQLAYAVKYIHDNEETIGQLPVLIEKEKPDDRCFFFSEDGKHIILNQLEKNSSKAKAKDMRSLGDLFCFISCEDILDDEKLTNSWNKLTCSEPATVAHLIKRMRSGSFTADDILKHPYFWNSMKKIRFLCSVCQMRQSIGTKPKTDEFCHQFNGWKGELTIKPPKDNSTDVKRDAVTTLLPPPPSYDRDSPAFELLRFFRNCAVHYWSNRFGTEEGDTNKLRLSRQTLENARKVFESEHEGFWNFFSTKFPDLLISAYKYSRRNGDMRKKLEETGYYSEHALFRELVRNNTESSSQTEKKTTKT